MKKRIELTATILMDIDIEAGKSELEQATQQINDWMDKHLDEASSIRLGENNARLYPDWVWNKQKSKETTNLAWGEKLIEQKIT